MNWLSKIFTAVTNTFLFLILSSLPGQAQSTWEGKFMEQFRVNIFLDGLGTGTIKMFDEAQQIQHDGLVKVKIEQGVLYFNIPAKQTDFKGSIIEAGTLITGNLIFPDSSLHPLVLHKVVPAEDENQFITKIEAVEDLQQLYTAIKQNHPDPFRYISPVEFDRVYSNITHLTEENISQAALYLKASELTEAIKCSHTGLQLSKDPQAEKLEIPIEIFYSEGNLYVIESPDEIIPAGSLITKINGKPATKLIHDLKLLIPVNGDNKTTKANIINRKFGSMYPLIDPAKEFAIEFSHKKALSEVVIPAKPATHEASEKLDLIIFEPRSEQLAYLKIPSFGIRDMDAYFANLENIFSELAQQNTKNLVLDLRDNSGGHPIFAAQLLSYLTDQEFTYFKKNSEIAHFEPLYHPMQANALHYTGNLYVFVNGGCLSTSGHLISLLKQYSSARFIGEQPGSTYTCNDFSKKIVLQNSGLELNLPTTTFTTNVEGTAKKVPFPIDYPVEETLLGKLSGGDAYWETFRIVIIPQEVY
jgi:hypothetical protein